MRPSHYVTLGAGLLAGLVQAERANLNIWDVDTSCTYHPVKGNMENLVDETDYLQETFDIVLDMAIAVQESLKFVLKPRPSRILKKKDYVKWIRIADAMDVVLGFHPNPDKTESEDDDHWMTVFEVIDTMVSTIPSSQNNPAKGYSKSLQKLNPNHKPMLVCGDYWDWLDMSDDVPFDPSVTVAKYWEEKLAGKKDWAGAWYKDYRFEFAKEKEKKPIFCPPQRRAVTTTRLDLFILCDQWFDRREDDDESLADRKKTIQAGAFIGDFMDDMTSPSFHELLHWFGGFIKVNGKKELLIQDQQAVNPNGYLVYQPKTGGAYQYMDKKLTKDEMDDQKLREVVAYGPEKAFALARTHVGKLKDFSGPAVATRNADSLTIFALMMYFDSWSWADEGVARTPGPLAS